MNKIIALIIAGVVLILSCAHHKDLSEEERAEYRRAREIYYKGQNGGP